MPPRGGGWWRWWLGVWLSLEWPQSVLCERNERFLLPVIAPFPGFPQGRAETRAPPTRSTAEVRTILVSGHKGLSSE